MNEFKVVCTDKRNHGRVTLAVFTTTQDGSLSERLSRDAKAPWSAGATLTDGEVTDELGSTYVEMAKSMRADYEGRERWHFVCPKCNRDVQLNATRWATVTSGLRHAGEQIFDVSLLPN